MAPRKTLIKENTTIDETALMGKQGTAGGSSSPGGVTLHPGTKGGSLPKDWNKTGLIASMIGAARAVKDEHLTKWYDEMIARGKELGHGVGVGDNSSSNKATINASGHAGSIAGHKDVFGVGLGGSVPNPLSAVHNQKYNEELKAAVKDDVEKLLSEDGLDLADEFKSKAAMLFEAALEARVLLELTRIEEEMQILFEEELENEIDDLKKGIEDYLEYSADEWMKDNEVAIDSSLRNEIATDVLDGLRKVFAENNIVVPEEQVDVIETMSQKIDELEERLNAAITENANLSEAIAATEKERVVNKLSEGLTLVEAEKLKTLVENVEAESLEDFEAKATTIKESQFIKGTKQSVITEGLEEVSDDNKPVEPAKLSNPSMKAYVDAISRAVRK